MKEYTEGLAQGILYKTDHFTRHEDLEVSAKVVDIISSKYEIPIIGCGGISNWQDAVEFFLAGASAVQIGSAVGNGWIDVFGEINNGIEQYMEKKELSKIEEMIGSAKRF